MMTSSDWEWHESLNYGRWHTEREFNCMPLRLMTEGQAKNDEKSKTCFEGVGGYKTKNNAIQDEGAEGGARFWQRATLTVSAGETPLD